MIDCIFTIDYEIYGNGEGSLGELVHEPARRLMSIFEKMNERLVVFVEAAELEKIETYHSDNALGRVRDQVREFHRRGSEIALHLHPQWCNAQYVGGRWTLDYGEYNLCLLGIERISQIVKGAVDYLLNVVDDSRYRPFSFRAGNWLLQPAGTAAKVLEENGIRLDSSVFKGGLQHHTNMDYRRSLRNGYFWSFQEDANIPIDKGTLLEIPIYARMVPFWTLLTEKRISLQRKSETAVMKSRRRLNRIRDYLRPQYPLKFDFCRMTRNELTCMFDNAIREDDRTPHIYKPLVAIGHTKDLIDFETVESFLSYLKSNGIPITTLREAYSKCLENSESLGMADQSVRKRQNPLAQSGAADNETTSLPLTGLADE